MESDMEISLHRKFPEIKDNEKLFYGGAQEWSSHGYVRGYGCGVIACANVLLHTVDRREAMPSKDEYIKYSRHLRHFYLPVIPKFGMNGIFMALGVELYFLRHRLPFYTYWGCLRKNIFKHMERMLKDDIPVVLSAGPNWPNLWGQKTLNMYEKEGDRYVRPVGMRAHYVTATALDDEYITVSSWGRKYYIKRSDFMDYARRHSNFLFSSIMVIKPFKRKGT